MFTAAEALGLVMAVLDGHHDAGDPTDPVGSALGKIVRALPEPVAAQAEAVRRTHRAGPRPRRRPARPGHDDRARAGLLGPPPGPARLPLRGRHASGTPRSTRGRSSSGTAAGTCSAASHAADARRAYRVDRVRAVEVLDDTFTPPADLDPVAELEEHLAVGWEYDVEVVIEARSQRGGAVAAPRARPARGGRRRDQPAGRQHQQPVRGTPSSWRRCPAPYRIVGGARSCGAAARRARGRTAASPPAPSD